MKVALTYNLKKEESGKPADYCSEFDKEETVAAIADAIRSKGHKVDLVEVSSCNLFSHFRHHPVDIVFNIAEGKSGRYRESQIPAILDLLNIPYTGSNPLALALALDKTLTKKVLISEGIPTPNYQLFRMGREALNPALKFPLIVKPNREGSAKGINLNNVVFDRVRLYEEIDKVINEYKQEVLVEEFIEGRELTVGVLENGKTTIFPILEIDFSTCTKSNEYFYSWRVKEFQGNADLGLTPTFYCPARLDKEIENKVKEVALRTHHAIGCFDVSRTDIRLNKDNVPYVLEINPLPGLDPVESNLPMMAKAAGMKYEDLVGAILMSASERSASLPRSAGRAEGGI
ncbi:MAG: ATP-grasp domain-containing protein [Candidatus Omnitrophica bacterium]|nr:ATP-grasp domain-containing protein [Candidatus Omnitrophota bacterium]MDD5237265.1 ATP-grasp domain-containing protein [Candidatus Omnitrophota bacterium]MDD5611337.1 ATP-grasp domain-containing protein [Candidatus Omnitrophota bacterium]